MPCNSHDVTQIVIVTVIVAVTTDGNTLDSSIKKGFNRDNYLRFGTSVTIHREMDLAHGILNDGNLSIQEGMTNRMMNTMKS